MTWLEAEVRWFTLSVVLVIVMARSGLAQSPRGDTLLVSDRYLVSTPAAGAALVAKFDSAAARTAMLRLDAPVTTFNGKRWLLGDILVTLDVNGNGYVATWTIAGPKEVIDAYLADFRLVVRSRHPIYDFGIRRLVVRCACD